MNKAHSAILCPYCGHTQRNMDVCEACGGRFDPVSRRGVQISMGPWHLHDERVPFRPGFSFTAVKRLITAGKLKDDSLIKGPTTKQLWKTAKKTAGVSHLLGFCHACGREASPEADQCEGCGVPFTRPSAHNELGIPYRTPEEADAARAELDRSIHRTQGQSTRIPLQHHETVGALTLCPYCGQWQKSDERCQSCGGLFDAHSLEATLIAMGPWFVRNKRFPYIPGCSFEVLKKQIDAGRIDGSTILRGPMTKQLWAVARNVPGVSHLVGFCHHCGASAKAGDAKCASCEAPFPSVGQQNVLGLAFATEAEAAAAEEQLAEQFNLTAPPTPIAPPMPTSVTGDTTSHAATGADVLSGLDRASLAVLATTRDTTASGSGHEGASPGRTPPVHGDGHASKRTLLLAGAIAAAIAIVVLIIALSGGKNDAPPQPQAKNPPVQPPVKETPPEPEAIVDTAIRMHDTVHTAWNRVETLDREGMIGVMIESAWDSMKRADTLLNEKAWDKALAVYDEAKVELDTIIEQSKLREDARQAKFEAESQMLLVTSTTLPVELMPDLEAIQFKFDEAVIHFQGGSFDKAKEAWQTVVASANTLLEKAKSPRGVDAD